MSYSDPDILEAPVHPVLFEIQQDEQVVQMINPTKSFTIRFSIYIPYELRQEIGNRNYFVYVTLSDNDDMPIAQKVARVTSPHNQEIKVLQFASQFEPIDSINNDVVNIQMAITTKHQGEMGIGESLRTERFINTYIPLENHYE